MNSQKFDNLLTLLVCNEYKCLHQIDVLCDSVEMMDSVVKEFLGLFKDNENYNVKVEYPDKSILPISLNKDKIRENLIDIYGEYLGITKEVKHKSLIKRILNKIFRLR